jgi:hypothetical protein
MNRLSGRPRGGVLAIVAAISAILGVSCTISKNDAPGVSAPSEFATSLTLSASPEVLPQDGTSQAVVTVLARDASSKPIPNLAIRWNATASTTNVQSFSLSASTSITDASGRTAVVLTAPARPAQQLATRDYITVTATPVADSVTQVEPRRVLV